MKEEIQIIERDGKPEWAVLPYEEYLELVEQAELLEDIRDFDEIRAAIERGEEELIPAEVVNASQAAAAESIAGSAWYWDLKPDYRQGKYSRYEKSVLQIHPFFFSRSISAVRFL
jgi:hypothetical protein